MPKKQKDKNPSERIKKIHHSQYVPVLLIVLALVLLSIGAAQLFQRKRATTGVAGLPDSSQTITYDTPTPDEKKPDIEDETYVVAADLPRRITMDSVGINGFIQKVGVNDQNAMSVPTNIHVGGWFTDSVKPGEKGLSIIDGHVNGAYSGGIFVSLQRVAVGARFSIEFGDLTTKTFEVVSVQQVPEASSAELLFTKDTSIEAQLSLITCGGAFDSSSRTYEDRVIVKSKLIESSP